MAEAFPMATYNHAFEAGFGGDGGEKAGVTFTNCKASGEGRDRGRGLDTVVEESLDVVRDIMVQPGEDCASFVGVGVKGASELGR